MRGTLRAAWWGMLLRCGDELARRVSDRFTDWLDRPEVKGCREGEGGGGGNQGSDTIGERVVGSEGAEHCVGRRG
jgi:hypothetical protein